MSSCATRRWGVSISKGYGSTGEPRAQMGRETDAALKRMLAERERQDVAIMGWGDAGTISKESKEKKPSMTPRVGSKS